MAPKGLGMVPNGVPFRSLLACFWGSEIRIAIRDRDDESLSTPDQHPSWHPWMAPLDHGLEHPIWGPVTPLGRACLWDRG